MGGTRVSGGGTVYAVDALAGGLFQSTAEARQQTLGTEEPKSQSIMLVQR